MGTYNITDGTEYEHPVETQHSSGGGGGNMEARIAKLESDIENIKSNQVRMWDDVKDVKKEISDNFKWMIGGFVATAATTVCAIAWFYDAFKELLIPLIKN